MEYFSSFPDANIEAMDIANIAISLYSNKHQKYLF